MFELKTEEDRYIFTRTIASGIVIFILFTIVSIFYSIATGLIMVECAIVASVVFDALRDALWCLWRCE